MRQARPLSSSPLLAKAVAGPKAKTPQLKTVAKGGGISLLGNASDVVLNTILQLILARTLGPANLGLLSVGRSAIGITGIVTLAGLPNAVIRFVANYIGLGDRARAAGTIISAVRLLAVTALLVTPSLFFGADFLARTLFHKPELTPVLRILALSLPFATLTSLLIAVAKGFKRVEYEAAITLTLMPGLMIVGAVVVFLTLGSNAIGMAYVVLFSTMAGAVAAAIGVWRLYPLRGLAREKPLLLTGALLSFSWPLMLTGLINISWGQAGTLLLGALAPIEQAGLYHVALRVSTIILIFLSALNAIFPPIIAELYGQGDHVQLASMYKTVTRWGFSLSLPIFLVLFTLSPAMMAIAGPYFVAGAQVLQVLAAGQLISVATGSAAWMLTMTGHPRLNLLNTALTFGLTLILDLWLIPRYGALGAGIGGGTAWMFNNVLRLVEVYFVLRIHPYDGSYLKPLAAGALATVVALGLGLILPELPVLWELAILGPTLGLIYLGILLGLRLNETDRAIIQIIGQRLTRLKDSARGIEFR
jgi:O-antigen/teichoic acid export membrane protein